MLLSLLSRLLLRLLPLTLLLCAAFHALGGNLSAIHAGDAWQDFNFDYCQLPCFAGITPGQTAFDTAQGLLIRHVRTVDPRMIVSGASILFRAGSQSQPFGGLLRYDRGLVGEMRFNVVLPVGALLTELGTPDCLLMNTVGEFDPFPVIFWQDEDILIGAVLESGQDRVDLNANALALWLHTTPPNDCVMRGALPWRGFAPLWKYVS